MAGFDDGDLRSQTLERLGQLDALRSGADDDQARGQLLDLEDRLAGVVRNRVEALDFRKQRAASGRDQKIARGYGVSIRKLERVRAREFRARREHADSQ